MEEKKSTESNYFSLVNKTVLIFIAIITAFLITGIGLEVKAGIRLLYMKLKNICIKISLNNGLL